MACRINPFSPIPNHPPSPNPGVKKKKTKKRELASNLTIISPIPSRLYLHSAFTSVSDFLGLCNIGSCALSKSSHELPLLQSLVS